MLKTNSFREKTLITRLNAKDGSAFEEVYASYIDRIYRFIYFKVETRQEAEDLTSQTFLKLWQHAVEGKLKNKESFQAFLYSIARNTVIDYYRKSQKKKKSEVELQEAAGISSGVKLEDEVDLKINLSNLEAKIRQLKNEYQEVIILHYINELSIKEISEVMNKKKGATRVLLHRALKSLKELV